MWLFGRSRPPQHRPPVRCCANPSLRQCAASHSLRQHPVCGGGPGAVGLSWGTFDGGGGPSGSAGGGREGGVGGGGGRGWFCLGSHRTAVGFRAVSRAPNESGNSTITAGGRVLVATRGRRCLSITTRDHRQRSTALAWP